MGMCQLRTPVPSVAPLAFSTHGQRCTRVAEGGAVLQSIDADRGCFACMLGGDDGRTLFIVANHYGAEESLDGIVLVERVTAARARRP